MKSNKTYSWYITIIAGLFGSILSASITQFSISINELAEISGIDVSLLATSDSVKTFFVIIAMFTSGYVYNKLGLKKTILLCGICFLLPQFLIPYNTSSFFLLVLKAIQGMSSLFFPVGIVIIIKWMDAARTGFATAVYNGLFYGGGIIGGAVAGYSLPKWGMGSSYFILGGLGLLVVILCFFTIKEKEAKGNSDSQQDSKLSKNDINAVLKTPALWMLILGFIGTTWLVQAISSDIPLYANDLGYSSVDSGILTSLVSIGTILACFVSGPISDLFANKMKNKAVARILVMCCGYILSIVLLVVFIFINKANFFALQISVFSLAFAAAWGLGIFYSILPEVFGEKQISFVSGFAGGFADAGMPLGPLVTGVCFGLRGYWEIGFGTCLIVVLISLISLMFLIRSISKP